MPNEDEALAITGAPDCVTAARRLRDLGARCVIVKRGPDGCLIVDDDGERDAPRPHRCAGRRHDRLRRRVLRGGDRRPLRRLEHRRRRRAGLRDGRAQPARPRLRRRRARASTRRSRSCATRRSGAFRPYPETRPRTAAPAVGGRLMPKDVDHDERREELAGGGVAGDRPRRPGARDDPRHRPGDGLVGGRAGALLRRQGRHPRVGAAHRLRADRRTLGRASSRVSAGIAALRELVLDNLPLDDERELETKFLMNYWSRAIRGGDGMPRPRAPRSAADRSPDPRWPATPSGPARSPPTTRPRTSPSGCWG